MAQSFAYLLLLSLIPAHGTTEVVRPSCDGLLFATFNIQNFGVSKASRPAVMHALGLTLARYDLVAIQELSQMPSGSGVCGEHTMSAICALKDSVNAVSARDFELSVSPRIGDEQFVLLFDTSRVSIAAGATDPDEGSVHSRPPHVFNTQVSGKSMAVGVTHTTPSQATTEIENFPNVASWMEATFSSEFNVIAGDFNADGSYFDEDTAWPGILSRMPDYDLLVGNDIDTTVAKSSNTYDRILASNTLEHGDASAFVLEEELDLTDVFDEGCRDGYVPQSVCTAAETDWSKVALELSDHYPVEICLHVGNTTAPTPSTTTASVDGDNFGSPGDCAVVGFNAENPDDILVVLLADLSADEKLFVTDKGVLDTGALRGYEGVLSYTSASVTAAGTVLSLSDFSTSETGTFALSESGDQVIVFIGSVESPSFVCAFTSAGGVWQDTATSASTGALPPGLLEGESALATPEVDNAFFSGPRTGTPAELRAAIHDWSAWTTGMWTSDATNAFDVADPTSSTSSTTAMGPGSTSSTTAMGPGTTTMGDPESTTSMLDGSFQESFAFGVQAMLCAVLLPVALHI